MPMPNDDLDLNKIPLYICFILYAICIIILYLPKYDNSYIIALFVILLSVICIIITIAIGITTFDNQLSNLLAKVNAVNNSSYINDFMKYISLFILIIALSWIIYIYSTFNNELNGTLINEYKAFHNSIVFMLLIILFLIYFNSCSCGINSKIYNFIYIILIILYVCIGIMQTMLMYYSTDG